jgi:hypothetical protein
MTPDQTVIQNVRELLGALPDETLQDACTRIETVLGTIKDWEAREKIPEKRRVYVASDFHAALDAAMWAMDYCRSLWGASRGHPEWRKFHDAFVAGVIFAQAQNKNEVKR